MTMTKTMLVNKDARNSEATHLVYAPGHFDPTAPCPNALSPTQIPGLLSLTFIRCTLLYPLCSCPGPRYLCYSLDVAFKHACSTSKLKSHRFRCFRHWKYFNRSAPILALKTFYIGGRVALYNCLSSTPLLSYLIYIFLECQGSFCVFVENILTHS